MMEADGYSSRSARGRFVTPTLWSVPRSPYRDTLLPNNQPAGVTL